MLEVFKSKEYVQANALYRWLDERVFDKYYDCILAHADRTPKVILDVGCGTGQFAINYANKEPECQVYALDYSSEQIEKMMEIAKLHGIRNLVPVLSSVEDYVPDLEFDVIICSEMIHLIDDLLLFSKKLTSMLKIGGIIAVRTPSAAHIYERKYYDYFPTCRYIDLLRCKSKELIETSFSLNGTFIFESYEFDESRIIRTADLIRGTKMKLYSTLHLISQKEFSYGLQRMVQDFSGSDIYSQNFKMMLYLLKKEIAMEKKAKTERKVKKMKRKALVILNGEKLKEIFRLDYINTYIIIAVLLVYLAFPKIGDFLGASKDTIITIALAFLLAESIQSRYIIGKIEKKTKLIEVQGELKIDRLYQAIMNEFIERKYREINIVRIFAFSTKVIQPIIEEACQAANISISECKLLLHRANPGDEERVIKEILAKWKKTCGEDRIKDASFLGNLSDYCIIISDKSAIIGHYTFDRNEPYHIKYSNTNVIVVDDQNKQGRTIINGLIDRFDTSFEYWNQEKVEE